jgi:hypothetical protein
MRRVGAGGFGQFRGVLDQCLVADDELDLALTSGDGEKLVIPKIEARIHRGEITEHADSPIFLGAKLNSNLVRRPFGELVGPDRLRARRIHCL